MATQETDGLPGITLWDIARSLGRLESHAEQSDARMDRSDARMDRIEARLDRIDSRLDRLMFIAVLGIGAGVLASLVGLTATRGSKAVCRGITPLKFPLYGKQKGPDTVPLKYPGLRFPPNSALGSDAGEPVDASS